MTQNSPHWLWLLCFWIFPLVYGYLVPYYVLPGLLKKIQLVLLEISKRITSWFFALFVSGCLWIILGVINLLILDRGGLPGGPVSLKKAPFLSFPVG